MNSQTAEINLMPGKPQSLSATTGELEGEIDLQWDSVKDASSYVIELSKNKSERWQQVDIVSHSGHTVTHLRTNTVYHFRIAALNGKKQGPWSEAVSKKL